MTTPSVSRDDSIDPDSLVAFKHSLALFAADHPAPRASDSANKIILKGEVFMIGLNYPLAYNR